MSIDFMTPIIVWMGFIIIGMLAIAFIVAIAHDIIVYVQNKKESE